MLLKTIIEISRGLSLLLGFFTRTYKLINVDENNKGQTVT
jgi:uncharacterized membrane protein YphA (DoxX/SURF4 family)